MMTGFANSSVFADWQPEWSTCFAQEPEQDLEFDEGLEEDELNQHKPPTRRPLLWILLLLIVVGVIYWTMKPDLAKLPGLPTSSDIADSLGTTPASSDKGHPSSPSPSTSIPKFGEGDTVTLSGSHIENSSSMTLTSDAAGRQPGPRVKIGEALTILDGEPINQQWVYQIRTSSGNTGWISEKHLQKKL